MSQQQRRAEEGERVYDFSAFGDNSAANGASRDKEKEKESASSSSSTGTSTSTSTSSPAIGPAPHNNSNTAGAAAAATSTSIAILGNNDTTPQLLIVTPTAVHQFVPRSFATSPTITTTTSASGSAPGGIAAGAAAGMGDCGDSVSTPNTSMSSGNGAPPLLHNGSLTGSVHRKGSTGSHSQSGTGLGVDATELQNILSQKGGISGSDSNNNPLHREMLKAITDIENSSCEGNSVGSVKGQCMSLQTHHTSSAGSVGAGAAQREREDDIEDLIYSLSGSDNEMAVGGTRVSAASSSKHGNHYKRNLQETASGGGASSGSRASLVATNPLAIGTLQDVPDIVDEENESNGGAPKAQRMSTTLHSPPHSHPLLHRVQTSPPKPTSQRRDSNNGGTERFEDQKGVRVDNDSCADNGKLAASAGETRTPSPRGSRKSRGAGGAAAAAATPGAGSNNCPPPSNFEEEHDDDDSDDNGDIQKVSPTGQQRHPLRPTPEVENDQLGRRLPCMRHCDNSHSVIGVEDHPDSWKMLPSRKHGFHRPFHPAQIAAIFLTLLVPTMYCLCVLEPQTRIFVGTLPPDQTTQLAGNTTSTNISTSSSPLPTAAGRSKVEALSHYQRDQIATVVHIIFTLLCVILVVLFMLATALADTTDRTNEGSFCCYCCRKVLTSSKHCKACNKCVLDFDHHCRWLNCCIGGKNYVSFICYLGVLFVASVHGLASSLYFVCVVAFGSCTAEHVYPIQQVGAIVVCVLYLLVLAPLVHLIGFHVNLTCMGITTYDYIMRGINSIGGGAK